MLSVRCLSVCPVCLSVCNVGALWPNGWMDEDETWHADRPIDLGPGHVHCVRLGLGAVPQGGCAPKGHNPQFSAHICCGQMTAWIKLPLSMEVGLGPGDFVLDGDPAPLPKKGAEPPP